MAGRVPSREQQDRSLYSSSRPQSGPEEQQEDLLSRRSLSSRFSNPNIFSDEFSLDPLDPLETDRTQRNFSISSYESSATLRSSNYPPRPLNSASTESPPPESNPFNDDARSSFDDIPYRSSLPQKGGMLNRNSSVTTASTSTAPSIAQRSLSTSSRFSMPRALSPYTGATGPSHPYAMYPQVGVSRSPSITTTSTIRPVDRPLVGSNAPQHPYAMYPQNIVPEEGMDDDDPIPVGFPGHRQVYQRAPGQADDDVGDIIGPDGHLEQLPPYSRYPDGIPPKIGMGPASIASANRDREFHDYDRESPASGVSSRTLLPDDSTRQVARPPVVAETAPTPAPAPAPEAITFEEKLKRKGKQRLCCGVPIWMIVLIGVVLLIGAGIGGVIGGVLGARKGEQSGAESATSSLSRQASVVTVTATSDIDATPLQTTPIGLRPLPTGRFQIPSSLKNKSKFCVPNAPFSSTWACMTQGSLEVAIGNQDKQPYIEFQSEPITGDFTYGAQAPVFSNSTLPLRMMLDKDDTNLGPALFFYTQFDKLVIVEENVFTAPASSSKRSIDEADLIARQWSRKTVAAPGDRPWFCWWNSTIMEFFLFVNETTNDAGSSSTTPAAASLTGVAASPTTDPDPTKRKRDYLSDYPRKIKMEEKRDAPGAQQPYCVQMQVMDDGSVQGPINQYRVSIDEIEPASTTTIAAKRNAESTQTSTVSPSYQSTCYCMSLTD